MSDPTLKWATDTIAGQAKELGDKERELTRLRNIEQAARELVEHPFTDQVMYGTTCYMALKDALESKDE